MSESAGALAQVQALEERIDQHTHRHEHSDTTSFQEYTELAQDLEAVWRSAISDARLKKRIARTLIEEGRNHLLLGGSIDVGCPVRILQGAQDPDVPWKHAFALAHRLPADDVVLTMIQDGDHRLSRPQDIARIIAAVAEIG